MMKIDGIEINDNLEVLVIVGPTASGKTALAIKLAKALNGEIISGDAFQVYKKMDIGTGKVTKKEMQGIKHHLIDIIDYQEVYDVSIFQKMARNKIKEILKKNKLPIIAGGTGLYIKACLYDYQFRDNEKLTATQKELSLKPIEYLQNYCQKQKIILNNSEYHNHKHLVNIVAKKMLNITEDKTGDVPVYQNFQTICIDVEREQLYANINKRVDQMFLNGLEKEVKSFEPNHLSQLAIGYKEIHQNLDNIEVAKELIKKNSRNFAKRQITWFNNQMDVTHYYLDGEKWQLRKN